MYRQLLNERSYKLMAGPATEPVTTAQVKTWLRIDGTDDDDLLSLLIPAARRMAEEYTKRAFITQTWALWMDRFWEGEIEKPGYWIGVSRPLDAATIKLSREPIISITSVKTYNPSNTEATVSSSVYVLDVAGAKVILNDGYSWPTDLRNKASVLVTYQAGYGADTAVPEPIKQAIKIICAALYESKGACDMPEGAKMLLDPFRTAESYGV